MTSLSFTGEIPWDILSDLVQNYALREIYLGPNKFSVTTIPSIVTTMTNLESLGLPILGYTGMQKLTSTDHT